MRAVIQRVSAASCMVNGTVTGAIASGFVILLGVEANDTQDDLIWLVQKVVNLRVFSDEQGLMNRSIKDVGGEILLISQFTLFAQTKKGNRPSFVRAAKPEIAIPIYERAIAMFSEAMGKEVKTGVFGADVKVTLTNDGPVTIVMDTQDKDNH